MSIDWIPRGLTIGIGAISPGFEIRPAGPRRPPPHSPLRASTASLPPQTPLPNPNEENSPLLNPSLERTRDSEDFDFTTTTPNPTTSTSEILNNSSKRRRERARGFSISGSLYVGSSRRSSTDFSSTSGLTPLSPDIGRLQEFVGGSTGGDGAR